MKKTRAIYLSVLLCLSSLYGFGQSYPNVNYGQTNINTVAPTSAAMMKAIDHPVSTFTGTPEVSHTLYTLSDNEINLPITLSYTASGIKVNEEASWVGLGWQLSVGGILIQNAIGELDGDSNWYRSQLRDRLDQHWITPNGYGSIPCVYDDYTIYNDFYNAAIQGKYQPDVYYFSFPGGSGKFFTDILNDSVYLIDDSNCYDIESRNNSGFANPDEWWITSPDGTVNVFSTKTSDLFENNPLKKICNTWRLSNTYLPNGQTIDYHYSITQHDSFYFSCHYDVASHPDRYKGKWNVDDPTAERTRWNTTHETLLDSITTDNYIIEFHKSPRNDFLNGKRLDDIYIRSRSSNFYRRYHFNYSYVTSTDTNDGWMYKVCDNAYPSTCAGVRLFLNSVCEMDTSGNTINEVSFDYYSPEQLPKKTSFGVDYWGYYNGNNSNSTLIPNLDYLFWSDKRYNESSFGFPKADRSCDTLLVKSGMLKSIYYPTGGKTVFDYESNQYLSNYYSRLADHSSSTQETIINQTTLRDNNANSTSNVRMTVDYGQKMVLSARLSIGDGSLSWDVLRNSCITIVDANGSVKTEYFDMPSGTDQFSTATISITPSRSMECVAVVNLSNSAGDQSQAICAHAYVEGIVKVVEIPAQEIVDASRGFNYGGGVRVRNVKHYDRSDDRTPSQTESYHYYGGRLSVPVDFCMEHFNQKFSLESCPDPMLGLSSDYCSYWDGQCNIQVYSSNNVYSAPYSSTAAEVSYDSCTVFSDGNGLVAGRTVYEYHNTSQVGSITKGVPQVNSNNTLNGKLKQKTIYDVSGNVISKTQYYYIESISHTSPGICSWDNFNSFPYLYCNRFNGTGWHCIYMSPTDPFLDLGDYYNRYTTMIYPIKSGKALLMSKQTTIGNVTQTENYSYDSYGQLSRIDRNCSDGSIYSTIYKYPHNFSGNTERKMTARNFISRPLEIIELLNGYIIKGQFIKYQCLDYGLTCLNRFFPKYVYHMSLSSDHISESTTTVNGNGTVVSTYYPFHDEEYSYDSYGNVNSVITNEKKEVYLWSYRGCYPVAKIEGMTFSDVSSALSNGFISALSARDEPLDSDLSYIRSRLSGYRGLITTYTFQPLVGMTTQTLPNGDKITYGYDGFGRLTSINDYIGKKVSSYKYHSIE